TLLIVGLGEGHGAAGIRTIDSFRQLRLDQASAVIRLSERASAGAVGPGEARRGLEETLPAPPRFRVAAGSPPPRRPTPRPPPRPLCGSPPRWARWSAP